MAKCIECKYNGDKCQHESNKGILIEHRKEQVFYIKKPSELNPKGKCKNYVELSEE